MGVGMCLYAYDAIPFTTLFLKVLTTNKTDNASIRIRNIVSLVHFQAILKLARESSVNFAEPYICVLSDDVIYGQLLVSLIRQY